MSSSGDEADAPIVEEQAEPDVVVDDEESPEPAEKKGRPEPFGGGEAEDDANVAPETQLPSSAAPAAAKATAPVPMPRPASSTAPAASQPAPARKQASESRPEISLVSTAIEHHKGKHGLMKAMKKMGQNLREKTGRHAERTELDEEYRDLLFAIELTQDAVEDLTVNLSRAIRPSDKVEKKLTKQKVDPVTRYVETSVELQMAEALTRVSEQNEFVRTRFGQTSGITAKTMNAMHLAHVLMSSAIRDDVVYPLTEFIDSDINDCLTRAKTVDSKRLYYDAVRRDALKVMQAPVTNPKEEKKLHEAEGELSIASSGFTEATFAARTAMQRTRSHREELTEHLKALLVAKRDYFKHCAALCDDALEQIETIHAKTEAPESDPAIRAVQKFT